jgi:membrane protein YdbS with pleckstrin-like domain
MAIKVLKGRLDPTYKKVFWIKVVIVLASIWSVILGLVILLSYSDIPTIAFDIINYIGIGLTLLIAIPSYLYVELFFNNFVYSLEKDYVRIQKSVLTRKDIRIPYSRIQNVDIISGLIQRGYGISTIQVQTAGRAISAQGTLSPEGVIPGIRNPEKVVGDILKKTKKGKSGV